MRVCLRKDTGNEQLQFRIAVRSGAKNSSYEVIFRPNSSLSPYRSQFTISCESLWNKKRWCWWQCIYHKNKRILFDFIFWENFLELVVSINMEVFLLQYNKIICTSFCFFTCIHVFVVSWSNADNFLSTGLKIVPCFYPSEFGKWMVLVIRGTFFFLIQQFLFYGKILAEGVY